jgi:hypothetical protein
MITTVTAMKAVKVQPPRDWQSFSLATGAVVYKGRHYFVWKQGCFIGTYETLDDAVESLHDPHAGRIDKASGRGNCPNHS